MKHYGIIILSMLALLQYEAQARVLLPALFSDNMVLQQNSSAAIWGQATGSKVTVSADWLGKAVEVPVTKGKWKVSIPTPAASYEPHTIRISDNGSEAVIRNVLIGEVWICSGQSNMEMTMRGYYQQEISGAFDQALKASLYKDKVRAITVERYESETPRGAFRGKWVIPDPGSVMGISATAWYFATALADMTGVPVGIICTSRSSSKIEAWIPKEILSAEFGYDVEKINSDPGIRGISKCGLLYNGMLAPVAGYTAKGFLWYQGESNRDNPGAYSGLMSAMVSCWREQWGDYDADMPFIYVQIAPYAYENDPDGLSVPELVDAQLKASELIRNSAVVATTDIGLKYRIHPPVKDIVGRRAAVEACRKAYSIDIPDASGMKVSKAEFAGGKVFVTFDNAGYGLKDNDDIKGFELAGADGIFHKAEASIIKGKPMVVVSSDKVKVPAEVRYAYRNYIETNLENTLGYPAFPFRFAAGQGAK